MDKDKIIQEIAQNMGVMGRAMAMKHHQPFSKGMPTHAQIGVLFALMHGGPQTVKELAAHFGMTSSAATQLVNGLEEEGFLSRTEDQKDRRKTRLELTAKGKKHMADLKEKRYEMMREILETLSNEELLQLKQIQEKINEHVKLLWTKNQDK